MQMAKSFSKVKVMNRGQAKVIWVLVPGYLVP